MFSLWTFPSPCGEKVGINVRQQNYPRYRGEKMFPSPCGEKVGINLELDWPRWQGDVVSVPLRGKGRDQLRVSSPSSWVMKKTFPSPCGEKVGINSTCASAQWILLIVSVPLRGKGRDQLASALGAPRKSLHAVSVPLRGKGRDQLSILLGHWDEKLDYEFPSPCGEKVGINIIMTSDYKTLGDVSVPLRGKGRDQRTIAVGLVPGSLPSFRPLAGKR